MIWIRGRSRELTCAAFFFAVLFFSQGHSHELKSEERAEFLSPQAATLTHTVGRVVASTASLTLAAEHEEQYSSSWKVGKRRRSEARNHILLREVEAEFLLMSTKKCTLAREHDLPRIVPPSVYSLKKTYLFKRTKVKAGEGATTEKQTPRT